MKFGRLVHRYQGKTIIDNTAIYNIGDNMQTFAIDNIYKIMGIDSKDIVDINFCEMQHYQGDYVIVPMAGYASHYKRFEQLPASPKIIPLFISFEMSDVTCDDIIPYLKNYAPIGCRDEATMKLLRKKGVEAYISGCLTLTLPKRDKEPKEKKVFFVDISSKLERYIPDELKRNCEYITHEGIIRHVPMTENDRQEIDLYAQSILEKYKNEATLVVTSRLHAASPCIALGIPVILAIDNIDERFSWLDKLIPIYDAEHYGDIEWNPQKLEIEQLKEFIIDLTIKQIQSVMGKKADIYKLSAFWENRERVVYNFRLQRKLMFLKEKFGQDEEFYYIIWGAGVHGRLAYSMVTEHFKRAHLLAIVDNYMDGELFGCKIIRPKHVFELKFDYALITTHPGRFEAVNILTKMKKIKNLDWCYFISKDIPEEID